MPAKRSKMEFKQLSGACAVQARASLGMAIFHLADATRSLETGVPCENCDNLRMILTFVDCARSLLQGATKRLRRWPEPPQEEGGDASGNAKQTGCGTH